MNVKKEPWNLTKDGMKNVIESLEAKLNYSGFQLEDRPRAIINIDTYENTVLYWALKEYKEKVVKSDE